MKTLLLIPSIAKTGVEPEVVADRHPTMDYEALRCALGPDAELVDYAAIDRSSSTLVRTVAKLFGRNAALATVGFVRRREFDTVFANSETVALPLALLFKLSRERPNHVVIGHRLSARKKRPFFTLLQAHKQIDTMFVYASTQRDYAVRELGIPESTLRLIPFHADHRFFRPLSSAQVDENTVCSAGLEWRDYPTLIDAVAGSTDLRVRLAAASPWSKHSNETESRKLPDHIDARRYDYDGLRKLYAQSSFVVVPLYENDFQAGVTTILEAMAMGKAVVTTRTTGQRDIIDEGFNGLYVAPASKEGWRDTISRLRSDVALRDSLGAAARKWVEENATLDHWVRHVVAAIRREPAPSCNFGLARPARGTPGKLAGTVGGGSGVSDDSTRRTAAESA